MKTKLFTFLYLALFAAASISFYSCSDDDANQEIVTPGGDIAEGQWVEEGNKLIYKITYDYGYGVSYSAAWTLTFDGDICVKSECACQFQSEALADAFYQSWLADEDDEYPVRKSGRTVTIDYTNLHKGMSKTDLKAAIGAMGGM